MQFHRLPAACSTLPRNSAPDDRESGTGRSSRMCAFRWPLSHLRRDPQLLPSCASCFPIAARALSRPPVGQDHDREARESHAGGGPRCAASPSRIGLPVDEDGARELAQLGIPIPRSAFHEIRANSSTTLNAPAVCSSATEPLTLVRVRLERAASPRRRVARDDCDRLLAPR